MTVSSSVPATIQVRRSRLVGLIAAAAAVAAGITWALLTFAVNTRTGSAQGRVPTASAPSSLSASERRYVKGITSLTPVEQAAAFGR